MKIQTSLLPPVELQATTFFFKNFSHNVEYAAIAARRYQGSRVSLALQLAAEALAVQALSYHDRRTLVATRSAVLYSQYASTIKRILPVLTRCQSTIRDQGSCSRPGAGAASRACHRCIVHYPI